MNKEWREIAVGLNWDHADALRAATLRDTPSLDVRLVSRWGAFTVEVKGPERGR